MILLSDTPWGDFPTWVQAVIAIPTLIIACITLLQEKKIKQLTDVVIELQNQTKELKEQSEILSKRYDLERRLSMRERMPYFEKRYFYKTQVGVYQLSLKNSGRDALDVAIGRVIDPAEDNEVYNIEFLSESDIKNNKAVSFDIYYKATANENKLNFSFSIEFHDGPGDFYYQYVRCINGAIKIDPPIDKDR